MGWHLLRNIVKRSAGVVGRGYCRDGNGGSGDKDAACVPSVAAALGKVDGFRGSAAPVCVAAVAATYADDAGG
ncbi:hypothetical protein JCM17961_12900 [Endothiovibrio diazotrophicus]